MNRGIQIVLLVLLFIVCGAVGYFVGGMLSSDEPEVVTTTVLKEEVVEKTEVEVAEEPKVEHSTKPEITNTPTPKLNSDNKTYRLVVEAIVESGDELSYYITTGNHDDIVAESENGIFEKLPHSSNGEYQVWVKNTATGQVDTCVVDGFVEKKTKPSIVALTTSELNNALKNATDDNTVPTHIYSRFHRNKQKVINAANGDIIYENFNLLWEDVFTNTAKYKVHSVKVEESTNLLVEIYVYVI
jgi:hypothetical protein